MATFCGRFLLLSSHATPTRWRLALLLKNVANIPVVLCEWGGVCARGLCHGRAMGGDNTALHIEHVLFHMLFLMLLCSQHETALVFES